MVLSEYYLTLKALHLLAMIGWMSGLLYLPRLFIYHLQFDVGSKPYATFCRMEWGLLKIIMLPTIILTFTFGILLAFVMETWSAPWFHIKILLVLFLAAYHGYLSRMAKSYARGEIPPLLKNMSKIELSLFNELPFLLLIFVVFLAILKPF